MLHLPILVGLVLTLSCNRSSDPSVLVLDGANGGKGQQIRDLRVAVVESVLNLPSVIKFSKVDIVRKRFSEIRYRIDGDSVIVNTSVRQQGKLVIQTIDTEIESSEQPCYVFKKLELKGAEADVVLHFDVTGVLAYGKLRLINGKWIPSDSFVVGVR